MCQSDMSHSSFTRRNKNQYKNAYHVKLSKTNGNFLIMMIINISSVYHMYVQIFDKLNFLILMLAHSALLATDQACSLKKNFQEIIKRFYYKDR